MRSLRLFDIFDTVLTRRVGDPRAVFYFLGKRALDRGLVAIFPVAFQHLRAQAELLAQTSASGGEPTLREIYAVLGEWLDLNASGREQLAELELVTEADFIVPMEESAALVAEARRNQERIAFVSDTYLPVEFIRGQLVRYGLFEPEDGLYVSSVHRKSKRRDLFPAVLAQEGISADAVLHHGNDPLSDDVMPRTFGIATQPVSGANLNRYELLLEQYSAATDGFCSRMAAAGRLARLKLNHYRGREGVIRDIGCSVAGPVLSSFVLWVMERARRRELRRLCFISRDGYVLAGLARILGGSGFRDMDFRYLYGSRQAWHLAGLSDITEDERSWILQRTEAVSLRTALARLDLRPEEAEKSLRGAGWGSIDWNRDLGDAGLERFWTTLNEADLKRLVLEKATFRRDIAQDYFSQEGITDGVPSAFVDLGWMGRLERSFRRLIGEEAGSHFESMYFALLDGAVPEVASKAHVFLAGFERPAVDLGCMPLMLEVFCSALHGSVIGYRREADAVVPLFRPGHEARVREWGYEVLHESVMTFAQCLADGMDAPAFPSLQIPVTVLLGEFLNQPSPKEAEVWGEFPFEIEQAGGGESRLIPPVRLSLSTLRRAVTSGAPFFLHTHKIGEVRWNGGIGASTSRLPRLLRAALYAGKIQRALLRRLKAKFRWMARRSKDGTAIRAPFCR